MANFKTIIIDFGKISTPYCGLAEVALNYSAALERLSPNALKFIYIVPSALKHEFDRRVGANNVLIPNYKGLNRVLYFLTNHAGFLCRIPNYDVYHYLHFYSPWGSAISNKQAKLLTIHDFHALERPRASKRLNKRLNEVSNIAFISNFACQEYKNKILNSNHRTKVITNGVKVPPVVDVQSSDKLKNLYGEFLFALGGLKRKNIHSLLGMLEKTIMQDELCDIKLLIGGSIKSKYKTELENESKHRNISNQVVFLDSITEEEKYQYMQACRAFVFPSLQEGFGLPIIEALHFGKPVFCSDKTSLPEVGGDKVYYWEEFDPDYMAEVLKRGLLEDDSDSENTMLLRKQYALKFDWDENAKQYVDYYNEIIVSN